MTIFSRNEINDGDYMLQFLSHSQGTREKEEISMRTRRSGSPGKTVRVRQTDKPMENGEGGSPMRTHKSCEEPAPCRLDSGP